MIDTDGKFYLGKVVNQSSGDMTDELFLYDPDDLTTHAVVVGMTGSGKTGLCIDLLEEAALNNIPALMIDPKGDITNALLHFPELLPSDFQPWVNADEARKEGKSIEEAAEGAASLWQNGLGKWGIGKERLQSLEDSAHFAIYTPGSDAGIPVSILSNLEAPNLDWDTHAEMLREKISGTVTAILGLVGMQDIDPVRSKEHILLSNVFENAWSQGRDLDLSELILQTQTPPFEKLGVFDVNTFFPEKDRFELAMLLNNILASPSFQSWIEGQPLNIPDLLYGKDGKPRHSVFYIAHLSDQERMFFVTLLYSAIETWMRTQTGTTSLRALVYFDEIFGYLPPVSNPPSKQPMLRMLKQARAFGVGQVLVTQNPVDVDYKALSNAGTWFIGKLQTEKDKERLLDGLEGAAPGLDRRTYDRLISTLGKRVFLAHNVHEKKPELFNTRWAMNYLTGPLTRVQIPELNRMVGASLVAAGTAGEAQPEAVRAAGVVESDDPFEEMGSKTRPGVTGKVEEYFLPNNLTLSESVNRASRQIAPDAAALGLLYRPVLLAQAEIRFLQRKYNLDHDLQRSAHVLEMDRRGVVRWDEWLAAAVEPRSLDRTPSPGARFSPIEAPLDSSTTLRSLESDFVDWAYRTSEVIVKANETLKVYAGPEVTPSEFRQLCSEAARDQRDEELKKVEATFEKKLKSIQTKLTREERELEGDEDELRQRKLEETGTHIENVASLLGFGRKKSLSTSLSKRRMTSKAKADVEESEQVIEEFMEDIEELKKDTEEAIQEVKDKWGEVASEITDLPVQPYKKDVLVSLFGIAWMPYHVVDSEGRILELPGFASE